jgi:two-component system cell cycle response regulator
MAASRILVIDDNPVNLKLASRVLQSDGFVVEQAPSAEIALERIRELPPDLILMDVQLPGMDGLALTRILKADSATRHIPVIALTAFAMKGDEERAREAGCAGYLSKPVNTRTLSKQVAEFLEARMKILVVEDTPSDLKLARAVLSTAGHEVAEAETGEKALEAIRESPPDLILVDLKLPGIDGLTLIRRVRQEWTTRDIPIVAVSAYSGRWTQEAAGEAGCSAYFTKPFEPDVLLERIADIRSRRRVPEP